jgi:hypothetical protein
LGRHSFTSTLGIASSMLITSLKVFLICIKNFFYNNIFNRNIEFIQTEDAFRPRPHIHFHNPIPPFDSQNSIRSGAQFLIDYVVLAHDIAEREAFQEGGNLEYFLSKAAYVYAAGEKRNESIPDFFTEQTRNRVAAFRRKNLSEEDRQSLADIFSSLRAFSTYEASLNEQNANDAHFIELKNMSGSEMRGLLIQHCFREAVLMLPPVQEVV